MRARCFTRCKQDSFGKMLYKIPTERCFTRCKQDSGGKVLHKIPLERCCTRFLQKGVSQGASQEKITQQFGGISLIRMCGEEMKKRFEAK